MYCPPDEKHTMTRENAPPALLIIWGTIAAIYFTIPCGFPVRTWCVAAFDNPDANWLDLLPFASVAVAVFAPSWFIYQFMKRKFTVSVFLLVIFSTYALNIALFAMIFHSLGIIDTGIVSEDGPAVTSSFHDYIYYSAVTFTTLGYGDFKPCESARLYAACEALLGGFLMPFSSAVVLARVLTDRTSSNSPENLESTHRVNSSMLPWRAKRNVEVAETGSMPQCGSDQSTDSVQENLLEWCKESHVQKPYILDEK